MRESSLFLKGDKVGAFTGSINADTASNMNLALVVVDGSDASLMHTHNALRWSNTDSDFSFNSLQQDNRQRQQQQLHLSLTSKTDFFGLADWDSSVRVDVADHQYAALVNVLRLAGDEVVRVDTSGEFRTTPTTV